jgi:hypothetical protein
MQQAKSDAFAHDQLLLFNKFSIDCAYLSNVNCGRNGQLEKQNLLLRFDFYKYFAIFLGVWH